MAHNSDLATPILVVDDDPGLLLSIKATLVSSGWKAPALTSDSRAVMALLHQNQFQLILLDLMMPHINGMDLLRQIKTEFPAVECVIISAVDEIASAVQAVKYGAYDYLVKPVDADKLLITVDRALERFQLRQERMLHDRPPSFSELRHRDAFNAMVAEDPAMATVFLRAETCAPSNYNIVISGETGTGKEMLARIIHRISSRSRNPFIGVNMGAFDRQLLADQLFGHAKGAFTGATESQKGFFETARGGTLFLDEITEMPRETQATLLRVVQERELFRLGTTEAVKVDVRLISSTNRNIEEEVATGRFRADLYHRLNTFRIHIPPLRERPEDILPLAQHFMKRHAKLCGKHIGGISEALAGRLLAYNFPGNVRELENLVAAACLEEGSDALNGTSLGLPPSSECPSIKDRNTSLASLEEVERSHIVTVLNAVGGNRTRAAAVLGIGLRTLQRKLKTISG